MINNAVLESENIEARIRQDEFVVYSNNEEYGFGPGGMIFIFSSVWKLLEFLGVRSIGMKVCLMKTKDIKKISRRVILNPTEYKTPNVIDSKG